MGMQPSREQDFISIPVSFDSHGGKASTTKSKVLSTLVITLLTIVGIVFISIAVRDTVAKIIYIVILVVIWQFILRFLVFKESHYSDIYETILEKDYAFENTDVWRIFDIDEGYPYTCYFKNGKKGIFVRMERGPITGKNEYAMYDHYERVSDSYNLAYSRDLDMVHIDYMDNVGNDERLSALYDEAAKISNPDMQDMIFDIYDNLALEMGRNYATHDIYLFLTKDNAENFLYNVQTIASHLLGGNFITYTILDRTEISNLVKSVFNIHSFNTSQAIEDAIGQTRTGRAIIPIRVEYADGTVEELNKTTDEKRAIAREKAKQAEERKRNKKRKKNNSELPDESVDIF